MMDVNQVQRSPLVRFVCYAPAAKAVFLAGMFNGWKPGATPMVKNPVGEWSTAIALPPGRYEFKFVVDGVWCCETFCPGTGYCCPYECVCDGFGSMNRVIEIQ